MTQPSQDQIVQNLTNQHTWVRLIYMLIYGIILHLAGALMWILCGVQFIFNLISGQDNQNVRNMCATVTQYIGEALAFVSYNSDRKPFPFNGEREQPQSPTSSESVVDGDVVHTNEPAQKDATIQQAPEGSDVETPSTAEDGKAADKPA